MTTQRKSVLATAALVAGVGAAWLAARRDFEPYQTADWPLALLVGWAFVGSGLIAWSQQPRNRLGPAMVLTGFAWFLTFLTDAHVPWVFTVGTALQSVYLVGFVFIVLSFPTGRLRGRLDRALIWAAAALVSVVEVVSLLFSNARAVLCSGCPRNVFEISRNDGLANGTPIRPTAPSPTTATVRTPIRPTAPSPTTAMVLPGPASAATAANQPVRSTSDAASSDG